MAYSASGVSSSSTVEFPLQEQPRKGRFKMRRASLGGGLLFSDHARKAPHPQTSTESLKSEALKSASSASTFPHPVNAAAAAINPSPEPSNYNINNGEDGASGGGGGGLFKKNFLGRNKDGSNRRPISRRASRNLFVSIPANNSDQADASTATATATPGPETSTTCRKNIFRRTFSAAPKTAPAIANGDALLPSLEGIVDESGFLMAPNASNRMGHSSTPDSTDPNGAPLSAAPSTTNSFSAHQHNLSRRKSFKAFKLPSFAKQTPQLSAADLPESKVWNASDAWKDSKNVDGDGEDGHTDEVSEKVEGDEDANQVTGEDLNHVESDLLAVRGRSYTSPSLPEPPSSSSSSSMPDRAGIHPSKSLENLSSAATSHPSQPSATSSLTTTATPTPAPTPLSTSASTSTLALSTTTKSQRRASSRSSSIRSSSSNHSTNTLINILQQSSNPPPPLPTNGPAFQSLKASYASPQPSTSSSSPQHVTARRQSSSVSLAQQQQQQKSRGTTKFPDFDAVLASEETTIRISLTPSQYGRVMRHSNSNSTTGTAEGEPSVATEETSISNRSRSQSRSSEGTLASGGTNGRNSGGNDEVPSSVDVTETSAASAAAVDVTAPPVPPIPEMYTGIGTKGMI
ncbi:hypothetical protein HDU97_000023 [Phlyctochytrium planicorne]|nr:hypothetical protein HDU97_000023 [Phlyctochytrium planicorne]